MKANCRQIDSLVQQYLDRELPEPLQRELHKHLDDCQACRTIHVPLIDAIRDVEGAPAPQMPAGLLKRVLEELPAVQAEPVMQPVTLKYPVNRWVPWLRAVAAAAATIVIAVWVTHMVPDKPTGGRSTLTAQDRVNPRALMSLATASCIAPLSGGPVSLVMASGQISTWSQQPSERGPSPIAVCMAMPPQSSDSPAELMPDVIQVISSRTVLQSGL